MLLAGLPLGFSFIELLLHLFNLAILLIALRLLLYKPVKKFIDKRQAQYKQKEEEHLKVIEETEALKKVSASIIKNANKEAILIKEEAINLVSKEKDDIIANARKEANFIVDNAQVEINERALKMKEEISYSLSEAAIDIAQKILEREVKQEDNDKIIDNIINGWKDE